MTHHSYGVVGKRKIPNKQTKLLVSNPKNRYSVALTNDCYRLSAYLRVAPQRTGACSSKGTIIGEKLLKGLRKLKDGLNTVTVNEYVGLETRTGRESVLEPDF